MTATTAPDLDTQWPQLFVVVFTDHGRTWWRTRRPLARVVSVTTPMSLAQAHQLLDAAGELQDTHSSLARYSAQIAPVGTPAPIENPWDVSDYLPGLLDLAAHDDPA